MASADYSVGTKVTADVSNFEKGMNKAEKALKDFSNKLADSINRLGKKGLIGSVANVTLAMQGLTKSFNTVIKFAKDVGKAINECTEAYKGQVIAERALDTAIQNNPFITGASSKALKQFASDMQRVSNYGDDELIPMMTNLVSLGRTESETMQIMSVAMDMSAGMGISLDTAITQLNATLNGNIGRLGQQNAELKGLTEEELKQGKAIEILGEKFKGLSSATADTSKQLQNIKGDFKEALGQFTLPSSDLWNKFWAGFYEKGIEVINKINAFMDAQIIGRKVANTITEQISKIPESNIAGRADYVRKAIKVLTDEELRALGSYLEGSSGYLDIILDHSRKTREEVIAQEEAVNNIANSLTNKIGKEQFSILRNVGQEMENRRIMVKVAKQEAEDKKKQADAEAQITAELQKQEEIAKKKTDWASKLLDQRIEMLETERDRAMELAEEEGKETYTIWRDYNNKILTLKLERLEKEKEKALEEEGLTAEDKIDIEEYYSGETQKIYNELGDYKKKKGKEEKKDEKSKFALMLKVAQDYAKNIGKIFKKIGETIGKTFSAIGSFVKNTFSGLKNIFSKLFEFNVSEALDSLLAVEDAILTFFVETLPQLPSFFESAFSSVLMLIQTLLNSIDWDNVKNILDSIINTFINYAPDILNGIVDMFVNVVSTISNVLIENAPAIISAIGQMFFTILEALPGLISNFLETVGTYISEIGKYITDNAEKLSTDLTDIVKSIVDGISNFITSGGWKNLLSGLLTIQNAIQNAITENLDEIVNTIIDGLPDLVDMLIKSIVSASKAMEKVIKPIIKLVLAIIEAIIDVLLSDEVLDAGIEAGMAIMDAIFDELIPQLAKLIPKLIVKIISFIVKNLPKLVKAMVEGLIKSFTQVNWIQVIIDIFTGFVDAIKDFFGIHSPSTLFESFGTYMVEGLVEGLKGISESIMIILQPLIDLINGILDGILNGVIEMGSKALDFISSISEISFGALIDGLDSVLGFLTDITKLSFDSIVDLSKISFDALETTLKSISDVLEIISSTAVELVNVSFKGLASVIESIGKAISSMTDSVTGLIKALTDLIKVANDAIDKLNPLKSLTGGGSGGSGGSSSDNLFTNPSNPANWVDPIGVRHLFGFANGSNSVPKGLAMVGEAGPELVKFRGGEQVLNSHNTQKALEGMGGTTINQNVTFNNLQDTTAYAMMNQFKQYNRQMAINGVI